VNQLANINDIRNICESVNIAYTLGNTGNAKQIRKLYNTDDKNSQLKGVILEQNDKIYILYHGIENYVRSFYKMFFSKLILNISTRSADDIKDLIDDVLSILYSIYKSDVSKEIRIQFIGYSYGTSQSINHAFILQSLINNHHTESEHTKAIYDATVEYLVNDIMNDNSNNSNSFKNDIIKDKIDATNEQLVRNALKEQIKALCANIKIEYVIAIASPNILSKKSAAQYNTTYVCKSNSCSIYLKDITYNIHSLYDSVAGSGNYKTISGYLFSLYDKSYPVGKIMYVYSALINHRLQSYSDALQQIARNNYTDGYEMRDSSEYKTKPLPITTLIYPVLLGIVSRDNSLRFRLTALTLLMLWCLAMFAVYKLTYTYPYIMIPIISFIIIYDMSNYIIDRAKKITVTM
jgi:hypothetical protein